MGGGRSSARRGGLFTAAGSALGHLALLAALLWAYREPPRLIEPETLPVELVQPPQPVAVAPSRAPTPAPAPAAAPTRAPPTKPAPRRNIARRAPPAPDVEPLPAGDGPGADDTPELSDAEIAGAATVGSGSGSGGGGAGCDMTRWLQAALRKDRQVQAAVAGARRASGSAGKPLFVWNGDWIRSHGEDGAGLAAVREAILWEVAFAPTACRTQPVHGLVLISLGDGPGAARLVVGTGSWRWSDLLRAHGAVAAR